MAEQASYRIALDDDFSKKITNIGRRLKNFQKQLTRISREVNQLNQSDLRLNKSLKTQEFLLRKLQARMRKQRVETERSTRANIRYNKSMSMGAFGGFMRGAGFGSLAYGGIGGIGGAMIAMGGVASVKKHADMDIAARKLYGLDPRHGLDFSEEMSKVREYTGKGFQDVGAALYKIKSTFPEYAGTPKGKEAAEELFKAARTLQISGDLMADVFNVMHHAMKVKFKDIGPMFKAAEIKTAGTPMQMAQALRTYAQMSAEAGLKPETIMAMMATVSQQGVPLNQAATQMRRLSQSLVAPKEQQLKAFSAMGINLGQNRRNFRVPGIEGIMPNNLIAALHALKAITGKIEDPSISEKSREQWVGQRRRMFPNVRELLGAINLGNLSKFESNRAFIANRNKRNKTYDITAELMEDAPQTWLRKISGNMDRIMNEIGKTLVPTLEKLNMFLDKVADFMESDVKVFDFDRNEQMIMPGPVGAISILDAIWDLIEAIKIKEDIGDASVYKDFGSYNNMNWTLA